MTITNKVCSCVLRKHANQYQVLVFQHPCGDYQIAKGTLEPNEDVERAALRELFEEAGIKKARIVEKLAAFEAMVEVDEGEPKQHWLWHVFVVEPEHELPEKWKQQASGSAIEDELVFSFFWQDLPGDYSNYHSCFLPVFALLEDYVKGK